MEPQPTRSSARLLAPISLIVCAFAVLVVIMGSGGGGETSSTPEAPPDKASEQAARTTDTTSSKTTPEKTYTVETGDTLGAIAEETGVPVETLQELNPALDPQALATGQKIKLVQ